MSDPFASMLAQKRQSAKTQQLKEQFEKEDKSAISKLSDADLASWQAQFPKESPQGIFAEQQWKYRAARRAAKYAAAIALLTALSGLAGYGIRAYQEVPKECPDSSKEGNKPPVAAQIPPKPTPAIQPHQVK